MFETLNDPVDVLTAFTEGKLEPLRFRWRGSVDQIRGSSCLVHGGTSCVR